MSTIKDFVEAVNSSMSATTKRLEDLWARRNDPAIKPVIDKLLADPSPYDPLHPSLDPELVGLLALKPKEIEHINNWPQAEKEKVRDALRDAHAAGKAVRFRWELARVADETTETDVTATPIEIYFQSPYDRVKKWGLPTAGSIKVPVPPHP